MYGVNPFSVESHQRFARKIRLPFGLISDRGGRIARAYRSGYLVLVRRTVYVVDRQGRIAFAERGQPPVAKILAAIVK